MQLTGDNADQVAARFLAEADVLSNVGTGRGIVTCAGSIKYDTCAWVQIKLLRKLGCNLPIEVWYLGEEEGDEQWKSLVEPLGVACVNAHDKLKHHPHPRLAGWESKAYAILHSQFREVLFLDADNVPVRDPNFLFDSPEYRKAGTVFWHDPKQMRTTEDSVRWKIFGTKFVDQPDQESGQLLIDKSRAGRALQLCNWYNEHSDFYYRFIYGDKDTFRFAWQRLDQPVHWVPEPAGEQIPHTLCQHDFEGKVLFQHRFGKKWQLFGDNSRLPGFEHENACLSFIDELRELWEPQQHLMRRMTIDDHVACESLSGREYLYEKPGINRWRVRLGEGGRVSEGFGPNEFFWWIENGTMVLGGSDGRRRAELARDGNAWQGHRLDGHSVRVALTAVSV